MPKYARFLKDMFCRKKCLTEYATVALTKETSNIINTQSPLKYKDLGSFSIPYSIGENFESRALCDLGSVVNLMPLSTFKKLYLGEANSTAVTLQLADRSLSHPYGIIEDVLVRVGAFIYLVDFIILDMEEDKEIPLIFGRPFMATSRALVDVEKSTIALRLGDEQITFSMDKATKYSNGKNPCAKVSITNEVNHNDPNLFANRMKLGFCFPLASCILSANFHTEK
ncbi:uncharacterized protein LOC114725331 [Neltuma alba]|uniref:uncharacterized protein LOC114725331 n=1 Tax=Neltuma alba TaxID=207710 RepID=UPI0010A37003|nr:uncharacterized protein LOC114725331 [Prosopis alba]